MFFKNFDFGKLKNFPNGKKYAIPSKNFRKHFFSQNFSIFSKESSSFFKGKKERFKLQKVWIIFRKRLIKFHQIKLNHDSYFKNMNHAFGKDDLYFSRMNHTLKCSIHIQTIRYKKCCVLCMFSVHKHKNTKYTVFKHKKLVFKKIWIYVFFDWIII